MVSADLDSTPEDLEARVIALEIAVRLMLDEMPAAVRAKIADRATMVEAAGLDTLLTDTQIAQIAALLRSMR